MQKTFSILIFLIVIFAVPAAKAAERQLLDQVIAVVNDEAITQSELDVYLRPYYEQMRKEMPREEQFAQAVNDARKKLLDQMIEDHLVFQQAKTQKIEIDETEIDDQLGTFKKRFKDDKEFEDALNRDGLTVKDLREKIRRQEMIRRLQDMEIRSKVVVSPREVEEYYEKNSGEFSQREQLKVRTLTLKKSDEAREKGMMDETAKNKIETLRGRLIKGEKFETIAKENSEDAQAANGGLGDWIERGTMISEIDDVIFALKKGDMSEIIETPMGYHIFLLEDKRAGYKRTFEEVRDDIFNRIFRKKTEDRFKEWLQQLRRTAYISIR